MWLHKLFRVMYYMQCIFFFFFKQKTAYEMRISDWSSDECSSDLALKGVDEGVRNRFLGCMSQRAADGIRDEMEARGPMRLTEEIGRASCRERVCQYV